MVKKTLFLLNILILIACSKEPKPDVYVKNNPNLQHFGFTLIDVGWDDPNDNVSKTNYSDEVYQFSNLADILVVEPTDNIIGRLEEMDALGMKAVLHLHFLFYEEVGITSEKSGYRYDLRPDYKERWDLFSSTNNLSLNWSLIQAFYIGEEPFWNGIDYDELKAACDYLKETFPGVNVMVIEAYPEVENIQVPTSVDWLGFDHYFIKNPESSEILLNEYNTLKSKRSKPEQKMVLIMDSHFIQFAHGSSGIAKADMEGIATQYFSLANNDEDVVAVMGYFWPSGFDAASAIGARDLPDQVKEEYVRIGKSITGK